MSKNIYPILLYGNPELREISRNIEKEEDIQDLIESLRFTMKNIDAIGLAAPQIGKNINLFVIDLDLIKKRDKNFALIENFAFINPVILEESGEDITLGEGCMSIPDVFLNIKRKSIIKIRYYDENWIEHKKELKGWLARVILHEYDHLRGILHIDKISPLKKKMIKSKLNKILKGDVQVDYRVKVYGNE